MKIQNTQANNESLTLKIEAQRREIESLVKRLEGLVHDLNGSVASIPLGKRAECDRQIEAMEGELRASAAT
jgi:predicted RNase H-like nuclease (RuvC/YqgF family)